MNAQPTQLDTPTATTRSIAAGYVIILLTATALYAATAQRGPAWQDSGMHQYRALTGQYGNPLGLALAHPLLIAMGRAMRIFGEANLPTAMNILSGVGMAVAVANVYLLGYWLTGRRVAAVLAAMMLAVCHTAWWVATVTETYAWVAAGLTGELLLVTWLLCRPQWWILALLALVNGLGVSLHNFALLPLPVYAAATAALVFRRRLPLWAPAVAAGAWLLGAAPILAMIIAEGTASGDWGATLHSALFGASWRSEVLSGGSLKAMGRGGLYIGLNWPFLSLAPVLIGWWCMPRRAGRAVGTALGAVALIHLLFAIRYPVPDQFMFLLPSYTLLAVGAAVGIDRICRMGPRLRAIGLGAVVVSLALTPVLYGLTPALLTARGKSIRPNRRWPERDENRYWITPWKHNEGSARRFADRALDAAAPEAIILPAGMATPPLQVAQRAWGRRGDVTIEPVGAATPQNEAELAAWRARVGDRPVYAVDARPSLVPEVMQGAAQTAPEGPLWRLRFDPPKTKP